MSKIDQIVPNTKQKHENLRNPTPIYISETDKSSSKPTLKVPVTEAVRFVAASMLKGIIGRNDSTIGAEVNRKPTEKMKRKLENNSVREKTQKPTGVLSNSKGKFTKKMRKMLSKYFHEIEISHS